MQLKNKMGLFNVKKNFLEELFTKTIFLFLIILAIGLCFVSFDKFSIFLKVLPFFGGIFVLFIIIFIFNNLKKIDLKKNKADYIILVIVLVVCIFSAFHFSESKIEAGHDQGGYFNSALLLSNTGSLYENYTERPISVTNPGNLLYGQELTRWHFIPGGATYYSMFHNLFGISGFPIALAFVFFFASMIIYFLCKKIRNWKTGLFFIIFFLLNFYVIYFSRATYVENIQLLLVWFGVFLFFKGFQEKKLNYMLLSFFPIVIMFFFRTEAILYFGIFLLVLLYFAIFKRKFKFEKKSIWYVVLILTFCLFLFFSYYTFDPTHVQNTTLGIFNTAKNPGTAMFGAEQVKPYSEQLFIWITLFYMFGLPLILLLIFGIFNLFKENKQTNHSILLVFLLILPQFALLIKPMVALYLPWAMRRFYPVLLPFIFILFSLFLTNKNGIFSRISKKLFVILVIALFVFASLPGLSIFTLKQGAGILDYEEEVSSRFGEDDLVIFWNRYGYENWGPPLYFLHGTNVVFDRGPEFDRKIYAWFMRDYEDVYIATSFEPGNRLYGYFEGHVEHIERIDSPIFKVLQDNSCDVRKYNAWPDQFKGYYQLRETCKDNNPPRKIKEYQIKLNIYKVHSEFKEEFIEKYYDPDYVLTHEAPNIWH